MSLIEWTRRRSEHSLRSAGAPRASASLFLARALCIVLLAGYSTAAPAQPMTFTQDDLLPVLIVYDNSGSMFPGYRPGGPGRSVLRARYFHEYEWFQRWLQDFVEVQSIVNGRSISMVALTSSGAFGGSADVKLVHPETELADFDVERAIAGLPPTGQNTYLWEGLSQATQGFEGLVWLITDNIVETIGGDPDIGVQNFFLGLRDTERLRAVHLFKLPSESGGPDSPTALAVYGILVSDEPLEAAAYFDRKFRNDLRRARRTSGIPPGPLFRGQQHLKLKDLRINALELHIERPLEVRLNEEDIGNREGRVVSLGLLGTIRNNLTQHSVVAGRYSLGMVDRFEPDGAAVVSLGVQGIPVNSFQQASGALTNPIPPTGQQQFDADIRSTGPLSITTTGAWSWIKAAVFGARVEYTGTAEIRFQDVRVQLERDRLAGIFGVSSASRVFDFQDVQDLTVRPARAPVRFLLDTGGSRGFLALLLFAMVLVPAGYFGMALMRPVNYSVGFSDEPSTVHRLRRLDSSLVSYRERPIALLKRGINGALEVAAAGSNRIIEGGAGLGTHLIRQSTGDTVSMTVTPAGAGGDPAAPIDGSPQMRRPGLSAGGPSPKTSSKRSTHQQSTPTAHPTDAGDQESRPLRRPGDT